MSKENLKYLSENYVLTYWESKGFRDSVKQFKEVLNKSIEKFGTNIQITVIVDKSKNEK